MKVFLTLFALASVPMQLPGQSSTLPAGLAPQTRLLLDRVIDSARADGIPAEALVAKAAEGRLKQATDAQIIAAVRSLATRLRTIRAEVGPLDASSMTAAATALAVGIPVTAIRAMHDAALGSPTASADLAGALVAATDLVAQRVSPASATSAVQSLLARRAPPEQYGRLRASVGETIAAGRSPDQAAKAASESIVKSLPLSPPPIVSGKPPIIGDAFIDARVPSSTSTSRNSK